MKLIWEGLLKSFKSWFFKDTAENLQRAAEYYRARLREAVNEPWPPPSTPGNPPHKRTGIGQDSIEVTDAKLVGGEFECEVTVDYAYYMILLEEGTATVAPRPWIQPTWDQYAEEILDIATGKK